jgi:hypothetical protein
MSSSKQGDKLAIANNSTLIEVYDFDRCSGIISNPNRISFPLSNQRSFFGSEFSPNGNILYVSVTNNIFGDSLRLYQFDLTNPNPGSTVQKLYCEQVPASGGLLKRGPDDKIYFSCLYAAGWRYEDTCRNVYNENLSVINNPDIYGPGCNFQPFSFYLGGKRTYWELPNNPNFLLGPLQGTICDSLTLNIKSTKPKENFKIFPNPVDDKLNIIGNFSNGKTFRLYNSHGEFILAGEIVNGFRSINFSNFSNGIYFIKIDNLQTYKIIVNHE